MRGLCTRGIEMANERVDKAWMKKGLEAYSTEAIVGTLAHYGVTVDQGAFTSGGENRFPLDLAREWMNGWKGTGQFASFPVAAADELWVRWMPNRPAPVTVARRVVELLETMAAKREGDKNAQVGQKLAEVEKLIAEAPQKDGKIDQRFSEEVLARFAPDVLEAFDAMAEDLAKEGHKEDAFAFVQMEERLLPEREGIASAVIQAVSGEKDQAAERLLAISRDGSASQDRRLLAVDALIHIKANQEAETRAAEMFELAEKESDFHFGLDLAGRLEHLYSARKAETELRALLARAHAMNDAHAKAHPHHHHH